MPIKDTIVEILQKRQYRTPSLKKINKELLEFQVLLANLRQVSDKSSSEIPKQQELIEIITAVANGVTDIQEDVTNLTNSVSNIEKRFSRGTINIGVAGTAKNGKSTLLQKISGLSNTEIPADIVPCTGTMSKVFHDESNPHAVIEFYSKQEFLKEILYPYFERLGLRKPVSLEEFSDKTLPEFEVPDGPEKHSLNAKYSDLKRIHSAFPMFSELLGQSPKSVKLEEIQAYIVKSEERTSYLAVKTANIYTKFPNCDVTGLCLVDLPGLEAAEGFEKKLVTSLEQQVDAVILVKMPNPGGAIWDDGDFKVIGLINSAIKEINLADWLFTALNELDDGSNKETVQYLLKHPPNIHGSKPLSQTANFYDAAQVDLRVFSPVLKHIEQNLESIDRQHVKRLAQRMESIRDTLSNLLSSARAEFHPQVEDADIFEELFDDFMGKLENGLVDIADSQRGIAFDDFETKVKEVCEQATQAHQDSQFSILPTAAELKRERRNKETWSDVVPQYIRKLRVFLSHFLTEQLDSYFSKRVDEVLGQLLTDIFPESLQSLSVRRTNAVLSEPRSIIVGLQQLVDKTKQPTLYASFDHIANFNLSYRVLFEYLVRSEISLLNPSHPKGDEAIKQLTYDNSIDRAQEIVDGLDKFYQDTIYLISEKLVNSQLDPQETVASWVEGIKDRLVTTKSVKREWKTFLRHWRKELWSEEIGEIVRTKEFCEHWENAIDEVLKSAKQIQTDFPI